LQQNVLETHRPTTKDALFHSCEPRGGKANAFRFVLQLYHLPARRNRSLPHSGKCPNSGCSIRFRLTLRFPRLFTSACECVSVRARVCVSESARKETTDSEKKISRRNPPPPPTCNSSCSPP
ncbi:AGAP008250-PA, partial [Anopheles gambiae str. PEST]